MEDGPISRPLAIPESVYKHTSVPQVRYEYLFSQLCYTQLRQLLVIFYSLQSTDGGNLCLKSSGSEMMGCKLDSAIVCTILRT